MARSEGALTPSASRHLIAIALLRSSRGYARVSDVARRLGITRGSASLTLKSLKKKGFVAEDENRFLVLTDKGQTEAEDGLGKQELLRRFLQEVLLCTPTAAQQDSSALAHSLSAEVAGRLERFVAMVQSKQGDRLRAAWREANRDYE